MGQMIDDVKMSVAGRWPVALVNRVGGMIPTSKEVADRTEKALAEVK